MKRLRHLLLWTTFFLALLVIADQVLIHVPLTTPGISQFQTFYRDFRSRLLGLITGEPPATIDQVIERAAAPPAKAPAAERIPPQRYIYVDARGELQFADSLAEVPKAYRSQAQPLKE